MKKLLTLIGAAALLLAAISAQAQAPTYGVQTLGTFTVNGQAATNVAYVIDCRKQSTVTVGLVNQMSTSATDNQTIVYSRSLDGVNYQTALSTVALAPTASATSVQLTNLNTFGAGFIKINYFTNAAASAVSTNTLVYAVKISAP